MAEISQSRIKEAEDAILNAPTGIQEEFQRTKNSWLACFGGHLDAIDVFLSGSKAETELGAEKYQNVHKRLENAKQKLHDLHPQYPEKDTIPSDDLKQELLDMLNVLK